MKRVWAWFVAGALIVLAGVLYIFRKNDHARRTIAASVTFRQRTEIERLRVKLVDVHGAEASRIEERIVSRRKKIKVALSKAGMSTNEIVSRMRSLSL